MSKVAVDGIVVVSDGGENSPPLFSDTYAKYSKFVDKDVPVYFYQLSGESDSFSPRMKAAGIEMQTFDLRGQKLDYYSIPNTVKSLNANPYSLVDEILQTPLLTLNQVLKSHGKAVLATA